MNNAVRDAFVVLLKNLSLRDYKAIASAGKRLREVEVEWTTYAGPACQCGSGCDRESHNVELVPSEEFASAVAEVGLLLDQKQRECMCDCHFVTGFRGTVNEALAYGFHCAMCRSED